jgi:uncharacterized protein (TIGR02145 family)
MRHLLLTSMVLLCVAAQSQTIMRIHQNNGTIIQIPVSTIDSITYFNGNPGNLATLTTVAIGNINTNSATSGGSITSDGGTQVTQRGICWATTQNPTTANNVAVAGTGTGSFTANLSGLNSNTTYYVRAYAINTAGTAYGNQLSFKTTLGNGGSDEIFNPDLTYGSVVDIDGNTYKTIQLGNYLWMAENLRTTKYSDGSTIPEVTDDAQWANNFNNKTTLPMMCWYNNDPATYTANKFGALYNWYAINPATNGNKNVCPTGWHVPADFEWNVLISDLDPSYNPAANGTQSNTAGGKMKTTGTLFWLSPNTGATNSSGFSGLPGGYRSNIGAFYPIGDLGLWWSSTEFDTIDAWRRILYFNTSSVTRNNNYKTDGFSIRCVKD